MGSTRTVHEQQLHCDHAMTVCHPGNQEHPCRLRGDSRGSLYIGACGTVALFGFPLFPGCRGWSSYAPALGTMWSRNVPGAPILQRKLPPLPTGHPRPQHQPVTVPLPLYLLQTRKASGVVVAHLGGSAAKRQVLKGKTLEMGDRGCCVVRRQAEPPSIPGPAMEIHSSK